MSVAWKTMTLPLLEATDNGHYLIHYDESLAKMEQRPQWGRVPTRGRSCELTGSPRPGHVWTALPPFGVPPSGGLRSFTAFSRKRGTPNEIPVHFGGSVWMRPSEPAEH